MYQRILVPLDDSATAAQALPLAKAVAAGTHSTVVLFRALEPVRAALLRQPAMAQADEQMATLRQRALAALEPIRCEFVEAGIPAECAVRFGRPAAAILEYAAHEPIDLIAMATHGRTGLERMRHGSVTDAVLRNGQVPLLVSRASLTPRTTMPRITRILVPLDGSTLAESALPHAQRLAKAFGATVIVFAIWDTFGYVLTIYPRDEIEAEMHEKHAVAKQYLIAKADALQASGVSARWQLQSGLIVESIVEAAERQAVSLIVMSTHGRRGFNRWVEGSVADEVVQATEIPILLIRELKAESVSPLLAR
jgi:nucleotide-binding universal stress UspA family protein